MHYQHRNPYRERDHRLSLMPLIRETDPVSLGALAWIAFVTALALGSPWWWPVVVEALS